MVIERQYVTPKEAAVILGYNVETVLRALRAGRLPGVRLGRTWRISVYIVQRHNPTQDNSTRPHATDSLASIRTSL